MLTVMTLLCRNSKIKSFTVQYSTSTCLKGIVAKPIRTTRGNEVTEHRDHQLCCRVALNPLSERRLIEADRYLGEATYN
jgi:hypothetical protein